jgi:DNA modification methylase
MDTGNGRFLLGDCFDRMRELPDASVDMVLADLPYGTTQNKWDSVLPLDQLWAEYRRLCRGAIVLTASQPFASLLVTSNLPGFKHDWVWEKNKASGHLNAKRQPMRAHEDVLVFGAPPYFPQMTEGHRPGNYARRTQWSDNYGAQKPSEYGGATTRYPRSVQQFDIINNDDPEKWHPTQKPVALFEYLIRTYTSEGQTVLDNTAGSGTTAIAAENTGRRWLCIEKDEDYYRKAVNRVKCHVLLDDRP